MRERRRALSRRTPRTWSEQVVKGAAIGIRKDLPIVNKRRANRDLHSVQEDCEAIEEVVQGMHTYTSRKSTRARVCDGGTRGPWRNSAAHMYQYLRGTAACESIVRKARGEHKATASASSGASVIPPVNSRKRWRKLVSVVSGVRFDTDGRTFHGPAAASLPFEKEDHRS